LPPLDRVQDKEACSRVQVRIILTGRFSSPDLVGYAVVIRKTASPDWEREIYVGNVTSCTLPNVNIDEVVLGVKALDKEGNESLAAAFASPPYKPRKVETY